MDINVEIMKLEERRKNYINHYLPLKIDEEDWHGVADCAMDLREVDAALKILKEVKK